MKSIKKPFIINSNFISTKENISSSENVKKIIANNVGNSYITYSIMKYIFGYTVELDDIKTFYDLSFQLKETRDELIDRINNYNSCLIICFQDQLQESISYNKHLDTELLLILKKIRIPICCVSLGANSYCGYEIDLHKKISPETIKLIKYISENVRSIGVRGEYTAEVLESCGIKNSSLVGCPTWYENGSSRVLLKNPTDNPKTILSSAYHIKIGQLSDSYPVILQDEWEDIEKIYFSNENTDLSPLTNARFFLSIERWKEYVSQYDFVFGTRVHGAIVGINSGVPAVITNSDARSREMCHLFGIPYYPGVSADIIDKSYYEYDVDSINKKYKNLYANYVDFMQENGVKKIDENIEKVNQPELKKNNYELNLYSGKWLTIFFYLPYYSPTSNGITLLWQFALDASKIAKVKIIIFNRGENTDPVIEPRCKQLITDRFIIEDSVVIYPDIVRGNPLKASRVARFILGSRLMFEGKDVQPSNNDFLFSYSHAVCDFLPQFNYDNTTLEKSGIKDRLSIKKYVLVYYGKCRLFKYNKTLLRGIIKEYNLPINIITRAIPSSNEELNEILRQGAILITFDPLTNLAFEATLLGIPVLFVDDVFKHSFESYNHPLHGYFYLSNRPTKTDIDIASENLLELVWSEYYRSRRQYSRRLNLILNQIHSHFTSNSSNEEMVNRYLKHEKAFYLTSWQRSPLYLSTSLKSVVLYHFINGSAYSKIFIILLGLFFFPLVILYFLLKNLIFKIIFLRFRSRLQVLNKYFLFFLPFKNTSLKKIDNNSVSVVYKIKQFLYKVLLYL
jgi:hypothetical protein